MAAVTAPVATDEELLEAARAGDGSAIGELLGRYEAAVTAVCRRRLRSSHDVADATQETFARALRALDQVRDPDRFGSWLCAIAARTCVDLHRRQREHGVVEDDRVVDEGARPDEVVVALDEARVLREHLSELAERDRRALWLRDAMELPIPDVARELGLTEGSARVMLSRARTRLRAAYIAVAAFIAARLRRLELPSVATVTHAAIVTAAVLLPGAAPVPAGGAPAPPRSPVEAVQPRTATRPEATVPVESAPVERTEDAVTTSRAEGSAVPDQDLVTVPTADVGPVGVTREEPQEPPAADVWVVQGDDREPVLEAGSYVGDTLDDLLGELPGPD